MSGKPYPEGVTKARALLEEIDAIEREATLLQPFVERSTIIRTRYAEAKKELRAFLNTMDVSDDQKGNYGWSGRFAWFCEEMHRQLSPARAPGFLAKTSAPSGT